MNPISLRLLAAALLSAALTYNAHAQHEDLERPKEWDGLAFGGRFMDRLEPMPLLGPRTADTWGVDAVKPRDVLNGIEEDEWSYWGGNIIEDENGLFHFFVCRWREDHPKGHMAWHESEVVRATSENRFGPYKVAEVLGPGHNPEAYRLPDGRIVCYVFKACFIGESLEGPWERKEFEFDPRGRRVLGGLSNNSFAPREDGSFLMVNRGGGMWVSPDGLSTWEQVTQGSQYPAKGQQANYFEDPVIWRSAIQYHMIVNNWHGRIAYHLRSKDGFHWKVDPGEAYTIDFAVSEDGKSDIWYKYERMKVLQDEHRRPIQANFAVIDFNKWKDLPNDIHNSKNISIPLTPGRLMTALNPGRITGETKELRLRIAAEAGFDPHKDMDLKSLRFGAPEEVNFGRGANLLRTERDGKDLIAVFSGRDTGFADHNFAGKLLGKTSKGKLLFGYCRLPWVDYEEPKLTVRPPEIAIRGNQTVLRIEVSNHSPWSAEKSELLVESEGRPSVTAPCPPLEPYAKTVVEVLLPEDYYAGRSYDMRITTGLHLQQPTVFVSKKLE